MIFNSLRATQDGFLTSDICPSSCTEHWSSEKSFGKQKNRSNHEYCDAFFKYFVLEFDIRINWTAADLYVMMM